MISFSKVLKPSFILGLLASGCLVPLTAAAQTTTLQSYEAAYFTEYAPRTASDMISQIPGFSIDERDDSRGLGQGGANVLINGARLTGKTEARDQLSRIASANVVRIDIVDGATLDIPGLSGQVANITTVSTGVTGTWEWQPRLRRNHRPRLNQGEVSISGERNSLAYTLSLASSARRSGDEGDEVLRSAAGVLLEERFLDGKEYSDDYSVGTDLTWTPKQDHTANFNAEYNIGDSLRREDNQFDTLPTDTQVDIISGERIFERTQDEWYARLGADYELPVLNGTLKVIGAHFTEVSDTINTVSDYETGALEDQEISDQHEEQGETIVRSEYSWKTADGHDLQVSAEGAFNFLDNDETRTKLEQDPSRDIARVEERRGELTLTYGRNLTERLNIQSSIGVEYSELSQTSASSADAFVREFVRPKGFITAAYRIDDSLTLRSTVEREVGQLDFGDFISSVDLQNGFDNSGNPDLVPQQAWLGNIELDKNFGDDLNFQANVYGAIISDTVERIPVGVDGEAVGNLDGNAIRYGIELSGAGKLDRWGGAGMQAEFELALRDSEVDDPLTGEPRPLSNSQQYAWEIGYRHDIPDTQWAYGGSVSQNQRFDNYRATSIIRIRDTQPRSSLYIEHKDILGVKVQARLLNLFDESEERTETRYTTRRGNDDSLINTIESNELSGYLFGQVTFSGTF